MAGLSQRLRRTEPEPPAKKPRGSRPRDAGARVAQDLSCADFGIVEGSGEQNTQLANTIEHEIIPRLMMVYRQAHGERVSWPQGSHTIDADEVSEFADLVVAHDTPVAIVYVRTLLAQGLPLETVCLDLLAPAARLLGRRWETDRADFTEVTIGLWRMQHLLRELNVGSPKFLVNRPPERRVLLCTVPGEQHGFGVQVVAEFLRQADWEVHESYSTSRKSIVDRVREDPFAVIGLSMSCTRHVDGLKSLIRAIRKDSKHRGIRVMVGGHQFAVQPELAEQVGADAMAFDGRQAVEQLRSISEEVSERR